MKPLTIAIAILLYATSRVVKVAAKQKEKVKIALMTASNPWTFGPYQAQMHKLSLLLANDDEVDYDVYWISWSCKFPKGVYKTYKELAPYIEKVIPPPADFPLDHITFLGQPEKRGMSASLINGLHKEYGFDCLITLVDITNTVPDEDFNMPTIGWIPLHSKTVDSSTADYWLLRNFHGIAGLSPSGADAIRDAVGKKIEIAELQENQDLVGMFGSGVVDFIPHIFDRIAIEASADIGLEMLKDYSVAEADSKLTKWPIVNRGQESTLESGHSGSLFGKERKDDFIVLLQGGNYEAHDRKGWDTSLQAFVRFYNSLDDPSGIHLLIHSMESYLVASDDNMNEDAPAGLKPVGYNIRYALHHSGIPRDVYTIDIAKHAPEVVAAYKKRADVCLHPSKVEGFGMNVMECQAVGTPVITTNYTAMGDFTKLGRSVPYRQTIKRPNELYVLAMPDVIGIADALGEMYEEHLALTRGEKEALTRRENEVSQFNEWIESTCSPAVVGASFKSLLIRSYREFSMRQKSKAAVLSINPPTAGAYGIVSGYHANIVDWDNPWTLIAPDGMKILDPETINRFAWMMLLEEGEPTMLIIIPSTYEDGTIVPVMSNNGEINEDLPVLVRTVMLASFQEGTTRRKSLLQACAQIGAMPKQMPGYLAVIERGQKSRKDSGSIHFYRDDFEL
mmetsp:Transcript_12208/g.25756  ORF Transcript_12208/g.25756 Transcript_12208/m.25756 type:complete len:677 (+) Transcript_12208:69-2099(+)